MRNGVLVMIINLTSHSEEQPRRMRVAHGARIFMAMSVKEP
jgi:hypothetical protein